ncbi:hypothetical protein GCM10009759_74970 [Kitasatospora saccharophila]|uniref:Uncharacterized protein n=1 Tax=Kitasatospora saccharophila TaxID=407973 RepID=A0ABN2Y8S4_9ACTN
MTELPAPLAGSAAADSSSPENSLATTVEEIRAARYIELDPVLVRKILDLQHDYREDPARAQSETEKAVNQWVSRHIAEMGTAQ